MEILAMVGIVIKGVVWCGYGLAGSYAVRTGVRYFKDYKDSVARERS